MEALRNRSWIVLVGLIGCLHLMPGLHESSHDALEGSAEAARISAIGVDCDACGLLSSARQATFASAAPPLPLVRPERLPAPAGPSRGEPLDVAAQAPRAPPTA